MNPTTPIQPIVNPLTAVRKNEVTIFQVRRHPIGLLGVHLAAGLLLVVLAIVIFVIVPTMLKDVASSKVYGFGTVLYVVLAALAFGFLAITHKVYWGNSWILTSDSLTQVLQISLFSKQSSQLSLGSLEDVTAEQNGIIAQLFHFGTLKVETAGEHSKFTFPFCPNPTYYAQQILAAREAFEQGKEAAENGVNQNTA